MSRRVLVVGAGVAGSAVAAALGGVDGVEVTVVERGPAGWHVGSTGHAPGFVGLLGEAAVLTRLAESSAQVYEGLHSHGKRGLDRVGGLEVAQSAAAWEKLERRAGLAADADLPARLLGPKETVEHAPDLVAPDSGVGGLLFPRDGTARARVITAALQERARARGSASFERCSASSHWSTGSTRCGPTVSAAEPTRTCTSSRSGSTATSMPRPEPGVTAAAVGAVLAGVVRFLRSCQRTPQSMPRARSPSR